MSASESNRRPRHSKREKITTLIAADMTSLREASRQTGIPLTTIRRWRDDPELAQYVTQTRDALADDILAVAAMAWSRLMDRIRTDNIETRDLIIAAGVAVDKSQLLAGMATMRTETRDVTGTLADAELVAAIREAATIVGGSAIAPENEAEG